MIFRKLVALGASFDRSPTFASVGDMLSARAAEHPDRLFLAPVEGGIGQTYRSFNNNTNSLANFLMELGVMQGDRISVVLGNRPEQVEIYFAAAKCGAVSSPLHPGVTPGELVRFVNQVGSSVLVLTSEKFEEVKMVLDSRHFPTLRQIIVLGECVPPPTSEIPIHSYDDAFSRPTNLLRRVAVDPSDLFLILLTSGTTGYRRAATHSHRNYLLKMEDLAAAFPLGDDPHFLSIMGLWHGNAVAWTMLLPAFLGGRMVLLRDWTPVARKQFWRLIQHERITCFSCAPTILQDLLLERHQTQPEKYDLSSLKFVICGTTTVPQAVASEFERVVEAPVLEIYGCTEVLSTAFSQRVDDRVAGSFGKPLPGIEAKILDPETGEPVSEGEVGEMAIRGHTVMEHGYWSDPDATREAFTTDRFFKTGDLVRKDAAGYWYHVGRKAFNIIVGGENVYPKEVEEVLRRHPDVQDVLVFGAFNPRFGESVAAVVVRRPGSTMGADEIIAAARERLSSVRLPRQIFFVDRIPHNQSGKPDALAVRARYRYFHLEKLLESFDEVLRAEVRIVSGVGKDERVVADIWIGNGDTSFYEWDQAIAPESVLGPDLFDRLSRGLVTPAALTDRLRRAYLAYIRKLLSDHLTINIHPGRVGED